ncbi:MAG: 4Fe-4S binding protein [Faecalibacillus faecis]
MILPIQSNIIKETFAIGSIEKETGYFINDTCTGCLKCLDLCPQNVFMFDQK